MSRDVEDAREGGLNALEAVLAAMHAAAFTSLAGWGVVPVVLALVGSLPTNPPISKGGGSPGLTGVSVLGSLYLGALILFLVLASRRRPRNDLTIRDRNVCIAEGLISGLVGTPLLVGCVLIYFGP